MDSGYLNQVKAILKSLVISFPDKITIDKLNRDYRDIEGEDIPFRRLGYNNMEQFLRQIPDTLVVVGSGRTALVYFVGNDKSAHIHEMIMTQKKTRPRARTKSRQNTAMSAPNRQRNNRHSNRASFTGHRMPVQQLSPFQITNRNVSTVKLTVRDMPIRQNVQMPVNNVQLAAQNLMGNMNKPMYGYVPQPVIGVPVYNPTQPVCNKEIIQKYQEHVKQLESLMKPRKVPQQGVHQNPIRRGASDNATQPIQRNMTETQANTSINRNQKYVGPDKRPETPLSSVTPKTTTSQPVTQKSVPENQKDSEINEKYQEHVKQLESLLGSSCRITDPPTARKVTFSPDIKNDMKITVAESKTKELETPLVGVNPPKPKVKLSERLEKILNATSAGKKLNPIEDTANPSEAHGVNEKNQPVKSPKKTNSSTDKFKELLDISEEEVATDMDEAVPEFAATSNVFRLDLPKHTVPFGRKIEPCEIPENIDVGSCLRIFISEIHNPFRFWFHIHKENHELDGLMHNMERFYGTLGPNELRIPIACLNPGQICAAAFNEMWHRGEIVAAPVSDKVKVSFLDYGTVSDVDVCDVKYLCTSFSQLPAQALRGCLSNIKPRGLHWSHDATMYFLSLVSEKMLYAKITEIDRESSVFYMILCDTHDDPVVQINKNMMEMKYALLNEDWLETRIEKNNGRRVHHPREDFPTNT
ncbi:tudor domain-containing protein 5 isoform X2 [Musca domestica]|uniref:Tudor domain-containing protein 5 isoform X2 n=1 Tax=Musca domestica TaxID=7370 RepID=A0A9J7DKG7_MUSDO|nr:tudor domain-containing protein 5 isoform X2 [Musca domestica]